MLTDTNTKKTKELKAEVTKIDVTERHIYTQYVFSFKELNVAFVLQYTNSVWQGEQELEFSG